MTQFHGRISSHAHTQGPAPSSGGTPPGAPSGVTSTPTGGTTGTTTWTAGSPAGTGYDVQIESPSGANNWTNAAGTRTGTSFAHTGLTPYTSYRTRVRATDGGLQSAWVNGAEWFSDNTGTGGGGVSPRAGLVVASGSGVFLGSARTTAEAIVAAQGASGVFAGTATGPAIPLLVTMTTQGGSGEFSGTARGVANASGGYEDSRGPRRKRYFLERNGRLMAFDDEAEMRKASDALDANEAAEQAQATLLSQSARKRVKKALRQSLQSLNSAAPALALSLSDLQAYAQATGQAQAFEQARASRYYEALLAMFEQQREEEDIEMLLLEIA